MSGSIIKPKIAEQREFTAFYVARRDEGLSGADARAATLTAFADRDIGRSTAYRWATAAENDYCAARGIAQQPKTAKPKAPPPPPPLEPEPPPPEPTGGLVRITHLPIGELVAEILTTFRGCMRYAVGVDATKPRNPALALKAASGLAAAIQVSLDVHAKLNDAAAMEAFTDAIMKELERADPALAQRVMARLDELAQTA